MSSLFAKRRDGFLITKSLCDFERRYGINDIDSVDIDELRVLTKQYMTDVWKQMDESEQIQVIERGFDIQIDCAENYLKQYRDRFADSQDEYLAIHEVPYKYCTISMNGKAFGFINDIDSMVDSEIGEQVVEDALNGEYHQSETLRNAARFVNDLITIHFIYIEPDYDYQWKYIDKKDLDNCRPDDNLQYIFMKATLKAFMSLSEEQRKETTGEQYKELFYDWFDDEFDSEGYAHSQFFNDKYFRNLYREIEFAKYYLSLKWAKEKWKEGGTIKAAMQNKTNVISEAK